MPLVLKRKLGESIVIGKDIRITYLKKNSHFSISLLIEAPDGVYITRPEVAERKGEPPVFQKKALRNCQACDDLGCVSCGVRGGV